MNYQAMKAYEDAKEAERQDRRLARELNAQHFAIQTQQGTKFEIKLYGSIDPDHTEYIGTGREKKLVPIERREREYSRAKTRIMKCLESDGKLPASWMVCDELPKQLSDKNAAKVVPLPTGFEWGGVIKGVL